MTDDGIAIHGAYALVAAKLNSTSIVLQTAGVYIPDVGDTFRLYNKAFVPAGGDYIVADMAQMERNEQTCCEATRQSALFRSSRRGSE